MSPKMSTSTAQSVADDSGEDTLQAADPQAVGDTAAMAGNSQPQSSTEDASGGQPPQGKLPVPLQKRRRVTRACDECRRKKIKVSAGVERLDTWFLIIRPCSCEFELTFMISATASNPAHIAQSTATVWLTPASSVMSMFEPKLIE
jgi:hypothetical protein